MVRHQMRELGLKSSQICHARCCCRPYTLPCGQHRGVTTFLAKQCLHAPRGSRSPIPLLACAFQVPLTFLTDVLHTAWQTAPCKTRVLMSDMIILMLLRFASDDIWGSRGRCWVISRSIAEYLVQAWDVRNSCKHNGAVLPLPSAPEGRGADGVDAMA
jgi:hypothetical protein